MYGGKERIYTSISERVYLTRRVNCHYLPIEWCREEDLNLQSPARTGLFALSYPGLYWSKGEFPHSISGVSGQRVGFTLPLVITFVCS